MPTGTPTTLAMVKVHLGMTDEVDDLRLQPKVDAANALVLGLPVTASLPLDGVWPADVALGATLLAAHLWRRKNSPAGQVPTGAQGAVYVQRADPDIAQLLRVGDYETPSVS